MFALRSLSTVDYVVKISVFGFDGFEETMFCVNCKQATVETLFKLVDFLI